MKNLIFYLSLLLIITLHSPVYSQEWSRIYKNPNSVLKNGEDKASAIAVDSRGNICVAGFSTVNLNNTDICLIKYDTNGDTIWTSFYNGTGNLTDKAYAITIDDLDFIYITGFTTTTAGTKDIITIKYSPLGMIVWVNIYNNNSVNGDDIGYALKLDNLYNLYVCGYSTGAGSGADYITLKYNADNGNLIWSKVYNGTGNSTDVITDITIDSYNNVIVTGNSKSSSSALSEDIVTIKYSAENGNQMWLNRYSGAGTSGTTDKAYAITVDNFDNVYITGNTTSNSSLGIVIISYSPQGTNRWTNIYNNSAPEQENYPVKILCTNNNFVIVTGTSRSSNHNDSEDFITIACHSNNGNIQWLKTYDGQYHSIDIANALTISESGKEVYVSGSSRRGGQSNILDIVTLKYKIANGDIERTAIFNNSGIDKGSPVGIAIDKAGNVFITGWTVTNSPNEQPQTLSNAEDSDILTLKYSTAVNNSFQYTVNNINKENKLYQNYPNPFNPNTVIKFNIPISSYVTLRVYDMTGREIGTMVQNYLEAGEHSVQFESGNLSSGTYLYELNANGVKDIKKMILLK